MSKVLMMVIMITVISVVEPLKCKFGISTDNKPLVEELINQLPEVPVKATLQGLYSSIKAMPKEGKKEADEEEQENQEGEKADSEEEQKNQDEAEDEHECLESEGTEFCTSMQIFKDSVEKLSIRGCAPPYECQESTCGEHTHPDSAYTVKYCCCDSDECNSAKQVDVILITIVFAALLSLC